MSDYWKGKVIDYLSRGELMDALRDVIHKFGKIEDHRATLDDIPQKNRRVGAGRRAYQDEGFGRRETRHGKRRKP